MPNWQYVSKFTENWKKKLSFGNVLLLQIRHVWAFVAGKGTGVFYS